MTSKVEICMKQMKRETKLKKASVHLRKGPHLTVDGGTPLNEPRL